MNDMQEKENRHPRNSSADGPSRFNNRIILTALIRPNLKDWAHEEARRKEGTGNR